MLHELKRYHGDVWINLDQTQQERGRAFVNALLDMEANRLDEAFRERLFKLTGGHPLFTIEIIRNMQEDGDIVQDDEGYWVVTARLDWDDIPARIEAVVEERIDRLDDELQDWLSIASVEGQVFTPKVLSDVHNSELRHVLKRLSRELERKHRLVQEVGDVLSSNGPVYQYTFTHSIFRQYIYSKISNAERRMLHVDVARSLEDIFSDDISLIVTQLAHHYTQAGDTEHAVKYLTKAAEFSVNVGDTKQARANIMQALEITDDLHGFDGRRGWLHYLLGFCEYLMGNSDQAEREYETSISMLTQANELVLSIYPLSDFGEMLRESGRYSESLVYFQRAYELTVRFDDKMQMSEALRGMGILNRHTGNYEAGMAMLEQALQISQEIDDKAGMVSCYNSLAVHERKLSHFDLAQKYYESAVAIIEENLTGHVVYAMVLGNLAGLLRRRGNYTESLKMDEKALAVSQRVGNTRKIAHRRNSMAYTYYYMQEYERSKQEVELGKPLADKIQDNQLRADFLLIEGMLALSAGKPDEAAELLSSAHGVGYHNLDSQILTVYAIALARSGVTQEANNIAMLAIDACDKVIQVRPEY